MKRNQRTRGAALITALMVAICTAMLLAASLTVAMTSLQLGYNQSYSETALQLADGGINSEIQFIEFNLKNSNITNRSSQPVVYSGVNVVDPESGAIVLGRPGSISPITGNYYVYSSSDINGTTPWNGYSSPFYITSVSEVHKCWKRVRVKLIINSAFNVYGTCGLSSKTTMCANDHSTVCINGLAAINGTISQGYGASLVATTVANCNTNSCPTGQYGSNNVVSGGDISSQNTPISYPTTASCLTQNTQQDPLTPFNTVWRNCSGNNGTVYEYKTTASSTTFSKNNCQPFQKQPTYLNNNCWNGVTKKSHNSLGVGTSSSKIQTLIFEPGDYYFTSIQLANDATKELVIDSCAFASGGIPGQVRFWVYDPNSYYDDNPADYISQPITMTCPSGYAVDPGQFRIYYAKDGCTLNFVRPNNIVDAAGNPSTQNFDYYCGIWSCTKPANDNSNSVGTTVTFTGCNKSYGSCNLHGSCLADCLTFNGCCNMNYCQSQNTDNDPNDKLKILVWWTF